MARIITEYFATLFKSSDPADDDLTTVLVAADVRMDLQVCYPSGTGQADLVV